MTKMRTEHMRGWASPSYDPATGRAASGLGKGEPMTVEGERINPSRQLARGVPGRGSPSWSEIDQQRCTDYTPIKDRPVG
jgi:hypothetical protein